MKSSGVTYGAHRGLGRIHFPDQQTLDSHHLIADYTLPYTIMRNVDPAGNRISYLVPFSLYNKQVQLSTQGLVIASFQIICSLTLSTGSRLSYLLPFSLDTKQFLGMAQHLGYQSSLIADNTLSYTIRTADSAGRDKSWLVSDSGDSDK